MIRKSMKNPLFNIVLWSVLMASQWPGAIAAFIELVQLVTDDSRFTASSTLNEFQHPSLVRDDNVHSCYCSTVEDTN